MSAIKLPGQRVNRAVPIRGEFRAARAREWQHGPVPKPPPGLTAESRAVWRGWFRSWVAAHWDPSDVPQLRVAIRLFDAVERGDDRRGTLAELRAWLDGYGLTPKGQADRRWMRPVHDSSRPLREPFDAREAYGHLRASRATSPAARLDDVQYPGGPYSHLRATHEPSTPAPEEP